MAVFIVLAWTGGNLHSEDLASGIRLPDSLPNAAHGHRAHLLENQLVMFGGFAAEEAKAFNLKRRKWEDFPKMSVSKAFFSSVVIKGKIYAIGGESDGDAVIECFDPKRNTWKVLLRSEQLPKSHFSAAAIGDTIYVIGGFQPRPLSLGYDTRTGEVKVLPQIPGAKRQDHFHFVANVGGKLHVLGGMRFGDGAGEMDQHWVWDGKSWSKRAKLPKPAISKFGSYGVLGDRLYIFNKLEGLHHAYDPSTDSWSDTPAPLPTMLVMPASLVDHDRLVVLGGVMPKAGSSTKSIRFYEPKTNRWHSE